MAKVVVEVKKEITDTSLSNNVYNLRTNTGNIIRLTDELGEISIDDFEYVNSVLYKVNENLRKIFQVMLISKNNC